MVLKPLLIKAMVKTESDFDPHAVYKKRSKGAYAADALKSKRFIGEKFI